jgi:hypothetical protein
MTNYSFRFSGIHSVFPDENTSFWGVEYVGSSYHTGDEVVG